MGGGAGGVREVHAGQVLLAPGRAAVGTKFVDAQDRPEGDRLEIRHLRQQRRITIANVCEHTEGHDGLLAKTRVLRMAVDIFEAVGLADR